MTKTACKGWFLAGMLCVCLLIVGCSQPEVENDKEKEKTSNEKSTEIAMAQAEVSFTKETAVQQIEQVTRLELTGPDKKYQQLLLAAIDGTVDDNSVEKQESNMRYVAYVKQVYGSYFTEEALKQFMSASAFQYHIFTDAAYEMKPVKVEVTQSDIPTADNQFSIDAVVEVTAPGVEAEQFSIVGRAFISKKDGRIGVFQLGQMDFELKAFLHMLDDK